MQLLNKITNHHKVITNSLYTFLVPPIAYFTQEFNI